MPTYTGSARSTRADGRSPADAGNGTGRGLTIIPQSTPLTSLNYFDGKFLRAADLRLEQAYGRTLVALTARGAGSGVVYGFELERSGDGLLLHGGLAVSASGGVIELPADAPLSVVELIARSESGSVSPGTLPQGRSIFAPCDPVAPTGPDIVLGDQPVYLITVASEAALCGEEERFDQLCADACLTETDRPRRVEGVRVRARRLALGPLPTSTAVTFTGTHRQSQVATAYFAAERTAIPDRISASGLLSGLWCDGAEPVTADEVPIGLLGRDGDVTTFLDLWSARREMMEPPTQRYWAWRMAMRPWDVFLAQVLQFQCQLADVPAPAPPSLVAAGFVTLPPAGYLPIDLQQPVVAQLQTRFGAGVGLRFGVAPADHVPEILKQAQDLDRISLTAGLDDPERLEPVDVLVPDGQLVNEPGTTIPTYTGTVRLSPDRPQIFSTVARDLSDGNLAWVAAGHADVPDPEPTVVTTFAARLFGTQPGPADGKPQPPQPDGGTGADGPDDGADGADGGDGGEGGESAVRQPGLALRLNRERLLARARRQRITAAVAAGLDRPVLEPDPDLAVGSGRSLDAWLDFTIDLPLADAPRGARARWVGLLAAYSRNSRGADAVEFRPDVELTVIDRAELAGRFGTAPSTVITTSVVGNLQFAQFDSTPSGPRDQFFTIGITGRMAWTFVHEPGRTRLAAISDLVITEPNRDEPQRLALQFNAALDATALSGDLTRRPSGLATNLEGSRLLDFELRRDDHALDPGRVERDLAGAVIETIGAELSLPSRDPEFVQRANGLLLGAAEPDRPPEVIAVRDWVLFTRRREVRFAGQVTVTPATTRSYLAYHAVIDDPKDLERFHAAGGSGIGDLNFERVAVIEYAPGSGDLVTPVEQVRNAFAAAPRGDRLVLQAAGDTGASDGELVLDARLAGYRGAIASLIDTIRTPAPQLLATVPDAFVSAGIDGVLFTVGLNVAQTGCQTVFGVSEAELGRVNKVVDSAGGWSKIGLAQLRALTQDLQNSTVATFADRDLTNAADVRSWWSTLSNTPPIAATLHVAAKVITDGTDEQERARIGAILEDLADPGVIEFASPIGDAGKCGSVVLLTHATQTPFNDTGEQLLVSMSRSTKAQFDQTVAEIFGGYARVDRDQLSQLLKDQPTQVASFNEGVVNADEVQAWWAGTSADGPIAVFVHPVAGATPSEELGRARAVATLLNGRNPGVTQTIGDALGSNAVLYLIRSGD